MSEDWRDKMLRKNLEMGANYPYVDSTDAAVDLAREKNAPVRVWIVADGHATAWKAYPSGKVRDSHVTKRSNQPQKRRNRR